MILAALVLFWNYQNFGWIQKQADSKLDEFFIRLSEWWKWYGVGKLWCRRNFFIDAVFPNSLQFKRITQITIRPFDVTGTEWFSRDFHVLYLNNGTDVRLEISEKGASISYLPFSPNLNGLKLISQDLKSCFRYTLWDNYLNLMD
jgi:hypothetical protein